MDRTDKLAEELKHQYVGQLETEVGKKWRSRLEAAEARHRRHSAKWEYLTQLYNNVFETFKDNMVWSTTLAIGWGIMNKLVDGSYFMNPQSFIEAKSNDPTGELSRELRAVINTIHEDGDTEGIMRQGMITSGACGFAGHWALIEQVDGPDGKAQAQRFLGEYVSPHKLRFDPGAWKWDLSDCKWLVRKFSMSLQEILDDPRFTEEGKKMARVWGTQRNKTSHYMYPEQGEGEIDPLYYDLDLCEIWSKVEKKIIWTIEESDISLGEGRWPVSFEKSGEYPLTLIAFNREIEDKDCQNGFYPKPDLELIEGPLEAINRLNELYLDAATLSVLKYLYVQGLIDDDEMHKVTSDKTRQMIPVDIMKFIEKWAEATGGTGGISGLDPTQFNLRNLIMLLPQEERAAMVKHQESIEHQLSMIANILSIGPLSRYGVPTAKSATETAALDNAKTQGEEVRANRAGRIYDSITRKFILLIKLQGSKPVLYRATGASDTEAVWREFNAQKIWHVDLWIRHRMGSSRPRNAQVEKLERKEAATVLLPIKQNQGDEAGVNEIIRWMLEPYDFPNLDVFRSDRVEIARELLKLMTKIISQEITPEHPDWTKASAMKNELTSKLIQANLTPKEMQRVAAEMAEGSPGRPAPGQDGGGQGSGSLPAPETPGEQAFRGGAAAAGRSNIQ